MLIFYIDESGNRDPRLKITRADGSTIDGDWLYVLTAVSLFEHRWHGFDKTLNRHKNRLLGKLARENNLRLELPDAELKSNWLRQPTALAERPFLAYPFFDRIAPHLWSRSREASHPFSGIHVFPVSSPLQTMVDEFEKQRAGTLADSGSKLVSGGANPIEPTSGTGQKTD